MHDVPRGKQHLDQFKTVEVKVSRMINMSENFTIDLEVKRYVSTQEQ